MRGPKKAPKGSPKKTKVGSFCIDCQSNRGKHFLTDDMQEITCLMSKRLSECHISWSIVKNLIVMQSSDGHCDQIERSSQLGAGPSLCCRFLPIFSTSGTWLTFAKQTEWSELIQNV